MNLALCLPGTFSQQLDPTQAPACPAALRPPGPGGCGENLRYSQPRAGAACLLPSAGCRCPSKAGRGEMIQKLFSLRINACGGLQHSTLEK